MEIIQVQITQVTSYNSQNQVINWIQEVKNTPFKWREIHTGIQMGIENDRYLHHPLSIFRHGLFLSKVSGN